jgi:hypothetical protein
MVTSGRLRDISSCICDNNRRAPWMVLVEIRHADRVSIRDDVCDSLEHLSFNNDPCILCQVMSRDFLQC